MEEIAEKKIIEEIKQKELIRKKNKKICKILNYTEHLLSLASAITEFLQITEILQQK